jgi:predicted amidohydrolase
MEEKSISIYQYNINPDEPEMNFSRIRTSAEKAVQEGSSLLILPELCLHSYNYRKIPAMQPWILPDVCNVFSQIARANSISIAGTFVEMDQGRYFNTFIWVGSDGTILHKYRKIHLFDLLGEGDFFSAGDIISPFTTVFGLVGAGICYDLRFPEFFRKLVLAGSRLIVIPAEWPSVRIEHWRVLLKARAIENQVFIVGVNCTGSILGVDYGGQSAVISPWGEILGELGVGEGFLTVKIDMDEIEKVRRKIPVWNDIRPEIYS